MCTKPMTGTGSLMCPDSPSQRHPDPELVAQVTQLAETLAARGDAGDPVVVPTRNDGLVLRNDVVVVKVHRTGTEASALRIRLLAAADPRLADVLLAPLDQPPLPGAERMDQRVSRIRGRLVSAWPSGRAVDPCDPPAAPWEQAGWTLARLHRFREIPTDRGPRHAPGRSRLPPAGGPARVRRAMARLDDLCSATARYTRAVAHVRAAFATLPAWVRAPTGRAWARTGGVGTLVHGDWHLGQLVRPRDRQGTQQWRLIDLDDLGWGDPAWDLARPAALYAAGVLPPEMWLRFLGAYQEAGGPGVPADGDPWTALDVPARAQAVQSAASAVSEAGCEERRLDEAEQALVDACRRIACA